ncbi:MAG: hypothetical protein MMC33_009683 [Icmadophila ericetorum]|nr:hypothetical protein [Icmadophila ericetorum]
MSSITAVLQPKVTARLLNACVLNKIAGLGRQFLQPESVQREIYRVLQPGGVFGLAIWGKSLGLMMLWEEGCQMVDPSYHLPPHRFDHSEWRSLAEVETVLKKVDFKDIHSEVMTQPIQLEWGAEEFLEFWYAVERHPSVIGMIESFVDRPESEDVKEAMRKVVKEMHK